MNRSNSLSSTRQLSDWNLLRSFLAIYETGTLTEAALRLNTTQPSMGRHLRDLEALIEDSLFLRKPGKLVPTERAHELFESLSAMRVAVKQAESAINSQSGVASGVVRITAAEVYAYHVVPALVAPLLRDNPELEIEMAVSNQTHNLLRRDADIAVRFFRPQQDDVVAVKVGQTEIAMFAHQDYLRDFGEPTDIDLPSRVVLCGPDQLPLVTKGAIHGDAPTAPIRMRFRTDFSLGGEAVVRSAQGICMMFVDIAKQYPELMRVLSDRIFLKQEVWLCAHDEIKRSARMRLVWDRLEDGLRQRFKDTNA